jgi:hypothetical protein
VRRDVPARPVRWSGAAAILAACFALTALVPTAAAASPDGANPSGGPTVDCVVPASDGTYRAVFGYDNPTSYTATVPVGPYNTMDPASLNGIQPTVFTPGAHRAAFATAVVAKGKKVSWTLFGMTVTASSQSPTCGPTVSLPAEGNGIGPVLVLAGSVLLSVASLYVRQWRQRRVGV